MSKHSDAAHFRAVDPATGAELAGDFAISSAADVAAACAAAAAAARAFRETTPAERAAFLDAIATEIEAIGEALTDRGVAESGLPRARLEGERGRTTGQLRLFAKLVRAGEWAGVVIDQALPDRTPLPRPDLRLRRLAVGPVAVFGASNFPLAFSVAGGDTASALAAGCPVVVKGHPAHPGVSLLVAQAVSRAVAACGLPAGVFSMVQGPANELGAALVADPHIRAVGFTGSRGGGLALVEIARNRPEPIPVYAEMASINPVLLMPAALAARAEALGQAFVASLTQGAGQFCTNPGLLLGIEGPDLDRFIAAASEALGAAPAQVMLTAGIHHHYETGVAAIAGHTGVTTAARGQAADSGGRAQAGLFVTDAAAFLADRALSAEVFGPSSLVVRCRDAAEMARVIDSLEGQLTATLQMDEGDIALAQTFLPALEEKAGRILANGWPTGVEVAEATVHGGPFPATSDPRTTSVGTAAIERFLRPVCYQNLPEALLPQVTQTANPLRIPQRLNS